MNKRILSVLFIGLLSLGCGESDPTKENNGTQQNNGANNGSNNGDNNGDNNGASNNGDNNGASNNGDNNGASNNGENNGVTNNGLPAECGTDITYYGQIANDKGNGGGVPGTEALTADAGLDALDAYLKAPTDERTDVLDGSGEVVEGADAYVLTTPLDVTEAVVIAGWNESDSVFWIEDGNRGFPVRLAEAPDGVSPIKIGDAITFKVTKLITYAGTPQISEVSDFSVVSSGNTVAVAERTGMDVTEADLYKTVRIQGTIGTGNSCGGDYLCYDMTHGDKTITFRSQSTFDEPGDCITFVGPLGAFPGPFADNYNFASSHQLNVDNFDWARGPFKE